jgi:hypothetical protein
MVGTEWGVGQVLYSIFWFSLFFIWIMLLIQVFTDIFRSHDMGGFAKTLWVIGVILFPYLGVFVYILARGHKMSEHSLKAAQQNEAATQSYIRTAAGSASPAEELSKLASLKEAGTISDAEFQQLKAKIVS